MKKIFLLLIALCALTCSCFAENLIEVSVEIAEVNNNKARELGIKWIDEIKTGELSGEIPGYTPGTLPAKNVNLPALIGPSDWFRYSALTADLKMLTEKGAAKIMSKPKLLTKSGSTAKFLVGGEFPVISGGVSGGSIEWKEYGIKLNVKPTVSAENKIETDLTVEVSRLDWANQVKDIPAIAIRKITSDVDLKSGETISVAGLIETNKETKKTGIPILVDIPLLGVLFGRHSVVDVETTIMIFVTPKIVR
ncbi:MAG: type II and III secretion system protein [Elusimicrobia bacterium]|nr:type II and III secretion system protein [Elusimicrobiota bacterium]MBU2614224.1 type II and III secretion system protein [Elusimicrobiota bacterium]